MKITIYNRNYSNKIFKFYNKKKDKIESLNFLLNHLYA